LHVDPDNIGIYENLALWLMALQRFEEARRVVNDALARKLDDYLLHNILYALAFLRMDSDTMGKEQSWFEDHPNNESAGLALASDAEAYVGHLRKARELTTRASGSATKADNKEQAAIFEAIASQREAAYGNSDTSRVMAAKALKLSPKSQSVQIETALAFAFAGDTTHVESLTQSLQRRFPLNTNLQELWLPTIQAQQMVLGGRASGATDRLKAATRFEFDSDSFENQISCLYPIYVRGEAYLTAGQGSSAAAEFQKILDHSGIVWNCWTGALAHLGVARANTLEGRTSQGAQADAARVRALAAYKDFLILWKDADPDIPILKEAKAEYAKLQ
jgi:eukaryotic-like serine/threonine-protein kinase